jgi:hypothetical protein
MEEQMDKLTDDGEPRTPLERIKAAHQFKREQILYGTEDELDWSEDILPGQAGLKQVWADDDGKLWLIVRNDDGQLKLKRIWQIV